MNNKGFAVSGIIYGVLVLFILLLASLLSMFTNRKASLDELKSRVEYEFNTKENTEEVKLSSETPYETILRGYYHIIIKGNGKKVSTYVFLEKGEKINIDLTGSNAKVLTSSTSLIDISSAGTVTLGTTKEFIGTNENTIKSSTKSATIQYVNSKKHEMLEGVRYIKDCTSGNNKSDNSNINNWIEIKAIYRGQNVALKKKVTANPSIESGLSKITDGDLTKQISDGIIGTAITTKYCVTVDLGNNYNLDAVSVYHDTLTSAIYYGITYVSSDGVNYIPIRIAEEKENKYGISVTAFEDAKVKKRREFYVAYKTLDDKSKWIRIFHHNNRGGKIMWTSTLQAEDYYPSTSLSQENINIHKQSLLKGFLGSKYSEKKYEFLLEYEGKKEYNRWTQTSNPLTTKESVSGYKKVEISWDAYALNNTFGGLCKSNSGSTLIDGTCGHGYWYYAIGAINPPWNNGIPAFSSSGFKKSVDLWLRIS